MTERKLPAGLEPERTTTTFTADLVPPGLLRAHHTTVWAELVVEAGTVVFVEEDPHWQVALTAPARQAIVPNRNSVALEVLTSTSRNNVDVDGR